MTPSLTKEDLVSIKLKSKRLRFTARIPMGMAVEILQFIGVHDSLVVHTTTPKRDKRGRFIKPTNSLIKGNE